MTPSKESNEVRLAIHEYLKSRDYSQIADIKEAQYERALTEYTIDNRQPFYKEMQIQLGNIKEKEKEKNRQVERKEDKQEDDLREGRTLISGIIIGVTSALLAMLIFEIIKLF